MKVNLKEYLNYKFLKKLLRSKSASNGMWLYLLQIFNTVIPLLTLPYITRVLGAARYGVFSIVINLIGYMQVVIEYGFIMSATRKVALMREELKENCELTIQSNNDLNHLFTTVVASRLILLCGCWIFSGFYIWFNRNDSALCQCMVALSFCLVGYCLQQNWLFQGKQDMKYISLISIVGRLISTALIFMLVKSEEDLLLYCILYAISPFISGVTGFLIGVRKYKIHFIRVKGKELWEEIISGWYVFTTQLSSKVFGAIGITFLGILCPDAVVGIYSAIQKIPNILVLAWSPVSQVLYPISSQRMTVSFSEGKKFVYKTRRIVMIPFVLIAIAIAVLAKPVVCIAFGSEYVNYYYWIFPLLAWLLIGIINNFLGIQVLLGSGHDKEYSQCFQIGVVCTIIFNFLLIYIGGGLGASFAPLLSELCLNILLRLKIKKIERNDIK